MARNQIAKKTIRDDATGVDFTFSDGTVLPADLAKLPEFFNMKGGEVVKALAYLACHGLSQKIGDSYAGAGGVALAIDWAGTTWEHLQTGEWFEERAHGAGPGPKMSRIVNAVKRVLTRHGKTFDDASIAEKYKAKEARDKAMANAEVKAEYDAIVVEEAQAAAAASAAKAAEGSEPVNVDDLAA